MPLTQQSGETRAEFIERVKKDLHQWADKMRTDLKTAIETLEAQCPPGARKVDSEPRIFMRNYRDSERYKCLKRRASVCYFDFIKHFCCSNY